MGISNVAVGKDDIVYALIHAGLSLLAQILECLTKTRLALFYLKRHGEFLGLETFIPNIAKDIQLGVRQYGLGQTHHLTVGSIRGKDTRTYTTDILGEAHDEFLTDRVDGRVGYLCKLLTEIVEEYLWTVADDGKRSVVTHRCHRFLTTNGHRNDGLVDVFLTKTESNEFAFQILHAIFHMTTAFQFLQLNAVGT